LKLKDLFLRWQERRRERVAEQYGYLSDAERAEVERLREEHSPHSPLGEMGRGRTPPPFASSRQRMSLPLGRTISQRPPNSYTSWQRITPGPVSPT
jgi:hypothetical protein